MINPEWIFKLAENSAVITEGGTVEATFVVGTDFTTGDHFSEDEYVPTFIIETPNGGYTVRGSDVQNYERISNL